ncbi:MAG: hypothetical protein IAE85_19025 [Anaerolinea sp.]|nr:hypothetical protein [Anaerolinea sp.]
MMRLILHVSLLAIVLLAAGCGPEPTANTATVSSSPLVVTSDTPDPAATEVATTLPTVTPIPVAVLHDDYSPLPTPTATWTPTPTPTFDQWRQALIEAVPERLLTFFAESTTSSLAEIQGELQPLLDSMAAAPDALGRTCGPQLEPVPDSEAAGVPAIIFTCGVLDPTNDSISWRNRKGVLAWRDATSASWSLQLLPAIGYISSFREARLVQRDGRAELALFTEQCRSETGKQCQIVLRLYRLEEVFWRELWADSIASQQTQREATWQLEGDGIEAIKVESTSSWSDDPKSGLFQESRYGAHRVFSDVWQRQGDAYVRTERKTHPSAFNTLVEFFYALQTGGDAAAWVTRPELLELAAQLELASLHERPPADWVLDHPPYPDPFPEAGPISLTFDPFRLQHPVSRIIFHFVLHEDNYLIDAIEVIPTTQTAP